MTLKIALSHVKSLLPLDFEAAVADFIKAKQDHRQTVGEPAPSPPHGIIESAIRRLPGSIEDNRADEFIADYEIVDDTPPPPTLDERKTVLANEVRTVAQAAIDLLSPPLKRRLLTMEAARAMAIEEAKRTPADKALIAAHQDRTARTEATNYHLALTEAQIHDLTDATIDGFVAAPFPN